MRGNINQQSLDDYFVTLNSVELEGYASEGIDYVDDMVRLGDNYGPGLTLAYNREFIEIEQYRVF